MRLEPTQIVRSAQVWVCDACGGQDHKSCGCNSTARMEALLEAKEKERQRGRLRREKAKENQSSHPADADVENVEETQPVEIEAEELGAAEDSRVGECAMRRRVFIAGAQHAVQYAKFDKLAGLEIDREMKRAAEQAVAAWTETLKQMEVLLEREAA